VLAGTRRKVKVEKIPLLSTASGADDLKAKQTKENGSAEAGEMPNIIDDTRKTDSDASLPAVSSSSALPSHSRKSPQKENVVSVLTTHVQNTLQVDAARIEKDALSGLNAERQSTLCEKPIAETDEKLSRISSAVSPEVEASHVRLVSSVQHQPNESQMYSACTSKPVINTSVQIEKKSCVSVEPVATAERQGREKNKPKVINVRRATDGPDQNCKTQ